MAKFFGKEKTQQLPQREMLVNKYMRARHNLLLIVIFTLINIVLLLSKSNTYFLFSATIPYYLADLGMLLCGKYPEEYYADMGEVVFLNNNFMVFVLVIAAVILLMYLLSWIFSKKPRVGWMIFALVFFLLDTLTMLWVMGISADMIIDIVFHIWVLVSLTIGIVSYFKFKKLPIEDPVEQLPEETIPEEIISEETSQAEIEE